MKFEIDIKTNTQDKEILAQIYRNFEDRFKGLYYPKDNYKYIEEIKVDGTITSI